MKIELYDLLVFGVDPNAKLDIIVEEYQNEDMKFASHYEGEYFKVLTNILDDSSEKAIVRSINAHKNRLEIIACKRYYEEV